MRKYIVLCCLISVSLCLTADSVFARVAKTRYPVVFAHGMMGFDEFLGMDYFGNDYGVFVGDPCDRLWEISCNPNIDENQQAFASDVNPFQSSEYRGLQLADEIEGYMATVGADAVNIIGHSQGGLDSRKAAKILYQRKGHQVVKALISISSPHRGSPASGAMLERGDEGFDAVIAWLADNVLTPVLHLEKGDFFASMKNSYYDDWDPEDGEVTGAKAFNRNYPIDNTYVKYYGSLLTSVKGDFNAILQLVSMITPLGIDGDGWCGVTDSEGDLVDCNHDGAAGDGDGDLDDGDDDGFVGLNSQQMGPRLTYKEGLIESSFEEDPTTGYVSDLNHPNEIQSTSYSSVLRQDHFDVTGLGAIPYVLNDEFDELQFYADLIAYIAGQE